MNGPLTTFQRLRMLFGDEDKRNLFLVPKFAQAHKEMVIIVADPVSDRIFVSYKGRMVNGRIRSARGKATHVVRDMMKKSSFRAGLTDQFIATLADTFKVSIPNANEFYKFVDAAVFNIAKSLHEDRKSKKKGKADRPPASGIPTPYVDAGGRARDD